MGGTMWLWILFSLFLTTLGVVILFAIPAARMIRRREWRRGIREFRLRREMLEARFFDLARKQGKPRDLRWLSCDWQDGVTFAIDRQSNLLTAFVGVNIRFEAVEGGDMEGVAAVDVVRDAAAVFHYRNGLWGTGGRALFNLNPEDALRSLASQYDRLPQVVLSEKSSATR